MNIPTKAEIAQLAYDHPAIFNALRLSDINECTFDEAMRIAVAVLAAELTQTRAALLDQIQHGPAPLIIIK